MTLPQFIYRFTILGLAVIGISIIGILASGDEMGAQQLTDAPTATEQVAPAETLFDQIFDETVLVGSLSGDSSFTTVGEAIVSGNDLGQRTLSLTENFRTNRALEKNVLLRAENGDFVNLGGLSLPSGSQEFQIPGQVDLNVFNEVQIYDQQLDVVIGSASLSAL